MSKTLFDKAQGIGLSLMTKLASSDALDQLKLRKFVERSFYHGSRTGFSTLSKTQKFLKPQSKQPQQRLQSQSKNLFDLSLTAEQSMLREALQRFAKDAIYPSAMQADHQSIFPRDLLEQADELALNFYALPEQYGGVATEQSAVSNVLIAEDLARGDFSLAAGLLSTFSVINAITRWGNSDIQSQYLADFAEQTDIRASIASQENTPAFNPLELTTQAEALDQDFQISGEKTMVVMGEYADILLVNAMYQGKPELFIVERDDSISMRPSPAMGLRAAETVTLRFHQTPARRLSSEDFDYQAFLDF